jgi:hypothetical protein
MSNYFINKNHNDVKNNKNMREIYSYHSQFPKNNNYYTINPNNFDINNNNSISKKMPINLGYKEYTIKNDNKCIYLDEPFLENINNMEYKEEKFNLNNSNLYKYNYNEELFENRKKADNIWCKNINLNLKSYHPINKYDEYIINYKDGLNRDLDDFMPNNYYNINDYNDYLLQNLKNKRIINNSNQIYNKATAKNDKLNGTNNSINLYKNSNINNNNKTFESFYNGKFSKDNKNNINGPYKKRVIQDYNFYEFKESYKNINNNSKDKNYLIYNKDILPYNTIKVKKIIKNNSFCLDKKKYDTYNTINVNNNFNYIKNNNRTIIPKKPILINNYLKSNQEELINQFIQHLSKYSMLYYFKIIKHLFTFLKKKKKILTRTNTTTVSLNNKIHINRIPIPPPDLNKTSSFNTRVSYRRFTNKSNGKSQIDESINALIERIKSHNESKSLNPKGQCEMYRNINELTKKFETITNRKSRKFNLSLSKNREKDMSFNNEYKPLNEFNFNSVDKNKNKEKFKTALNKERERRKKIMEKKMNKENIESKEKENKENK